jgi:hypothetical protein
MREKSKSNNICSRFYILQSLTKRHDPQFFIHTKIISFIPSITRTFWPNLKKKNLICISFKNHRQIISPHTCLSH